MAASGSEVLLEELKIDVYVGGFMAQTKQETYKRDVNKARQHKGEYSFFLYIMPVRHIDVIRLSLYPLMDESYRWVYFCISSLSVVPPACFQNSPSLLHTSAKWQKIFFPSPVSSCIMLIDHSQSSFDRTLLFLEFSIPPATHAFPLAWQCI